MDKIIVALNVIVVLNKIIPIRGRKQENSQSPIETKPQCELNKIIPIRGRKHIHHTK